MTSRSSLPSEVTNSFFRFTAAHKKQDGQSVTSLTVGYVRLGKGTGDVLLHMSLSLDDEGGGDTRFSGGRQQLAGH